MNDAYLVALQALIVTVAGLLGAAVKWIWDQYRGVTGERARNQARDRHRTEKSVVDHLNVMVTRMDGQLKEQHDEIVDLRARVGRLEITEERYKGHILYLYEILDRAGLDHRKILSPSSPAGSGPRPRMADGPDS